MSCAHRLDVLLSPGSPVGESGAVVGKLVRCYHFLLLSGWLKLLIKRHMNHGV